MKNSLYFVLILIGFTCSKIESLAQGFSPLIVSPQQETLHFATLFNEQILSLNNFNSHYSTLLELNYDSLLLALPSVNSVFSSLILYNNDMQVEQKIQFPSTKDSIFIYQNFTILKKEFSIQPWENEIVLFGTLLTPQVKTRMAL